MYNPYDYLVVGWGVEEQAQGPQVSHQLRVDPELEEKYKLWVNQELRGRDDQSSGEVEPVGQLEQS